MKGRNKKLEMLCEEVKGDKGVYIEPEREFACITYVRNKCGFIFHWPLSNILNILQKRKKRKHKKEVLKLYLYDLSGHPYATSPKPIYSLLLPTHLVILNLLTLQSLLFNIP